MLRPGIPHAFRLALPGRRRLARDVRDEIETHLDLLAGYLEAEGLSPEAARAEAIRRFGPPDEVHRRLFAEAQFREERMQLSEWADSVRHDLRYALRQLTRAPGFAAVVVTTLALGIGANAIMFGVVDRLLLRPPAHVAEPDRVVRLYARQKAPEWLPGVDSTTSDGGSYPLVTAFQGVPSLEVAGLHQGQYTLGRGADARQVDALLVTGNYFHVLGVRPQVGRFFAPDEDRAPVGQAVAVLSHGFWQRQFGGDRGVIGKTLLLDNVTFTVIGVAPEGFTGTDLQGVDMWVPVSALAARHFGKDWYLNAGWFWIRTIARLRPGATPERAGAEATVAYRRAAEAWAEKYGQSTPARVIAGSIIAARGPEGAPREAKVSLWLTGVSAIVLLIACANVANLLLARAVRRRREIAVRLALGVGRGRLVRQLLVETLLLAALAAGVALVLTHWGGRLVRSVLLPDIAWGGTPADARVFAFTVLATVVTGLLAGLAPAVQASGTDVTGALKAGWREGGWRRAPLRTALLVTQAALSVVLLVGAGLFVRSLRNVRATDVGMDLSRVLLVRADLQSVGFEPPQVADIYRQARERVARLRGVERAALVGASVPMRMGMATGVRVPGRDSLPNLPGGGPYYSGVSPDYLGTIGTGIVRGRGLTERDELSRARVMLINETVAKHYWPGDDPIGKCVILNNEPACTEVVGVAEDALLFGMIGDPRGQFYLPMTHPFLADQVPSAILVRASGRDAAVIAGAVRREVQSLAANMPFVEVQSFEQLVAPELQPWRLGASMFGVFGALALVIAAVGLYGVIGYAVSQRTHEMGVRIALGAMPRDVMRLVVGEGLRVVLVGLGLGVALALAAGRFVAPLLYQTSPHDPAIYAAVALVLTAVAAAASFIPARRASHVDPSVALRAE